MVEIAEQRLVQEFVAEPAVEALDEGVLGWLARRDGSPCGRHRPEAHGGRQSTFVR
jgi:hypothetical protein